VIETMHIGADRSRVWLVMSGESRDHDLRVLTALPLYPFMALDLAPLLEIAPGKNGERAVASGQHGAVASGHGR
jgi:hypothetical protein